MAHDVSNRNRSGKSPCMGMSGLTRDGTGKPNLRGQLSGANGYRGNSVLPFQLTTRRIVATMPGWRQIYWTTPTFIIIQGLHVFKGRFLVKRERYRTKISAKIDGNIWRGLKMSRLCFPTTIISRAQISRVCLPFQRRIPFVNVLLLLQYWYSGFLPSWFITNLLDGRGNDDCF